VLRVTGRILIPLAVAGRPNVVVVVAVAELEV
jgi:hypothetical protein